MSVDRGGQPSPKTLKKAQVFKIIIGIYSRRRFKKIDEND